MKILKKIYFSVLFILSVSIVYSKQDVFLEPISALTRSEDYYISIRDKFVGKDSYYWMIAMPSFEPAYAVKVVYRSDDKIKNKINYFIDVVQFNMGKKNEVMTMSKQIEWDILECFTIPFQSALMRVRAEIELGARVDGITYLFCFDRYSGQSWTPPEGSEPFILASAWQTLRDYVKASDKKSEGDALGRFKELCTKIDTSELQAALDHSNKSSFEKSNEPE